MNDNINSIGSTLMVIFCDKKSNIIVPEFDKEHCKLDDAGRLFLDMNSPKDRQIIDILITTDDIIFDSKERSIINRCYMLDGTALFISVDDPKES